MKRRARVVRAAIGVAIAISVALAGLVVSASPATAVTKDVKGWVTFHGEGDNVHEWCLYGSARHRSGWDRPTWLPMPKGTVIKIQKRNSSGTYSTKYKTQVRDRQGSWSRCFVSLPRGTYRTRMDAQTVYGGSTIWHVSKDFSVSHYLQ